MATTPLKVFVIAGEESGDILGGAILKSLAHTSGRSLDIRGIGGDSIKSAGLQKSMIDMHDLAVMGIFEILPKIRFFRRAINDAITCAEEFQPDIVLTIDSPDFCFRVQSGLRKRGHITAKQIHVVAPSVWAWRPKRAAKIAKFLDGLVCLLPFEPPYFEEHGLAAVSIGHPAINAPIAWADPHPFRDAIGARADDRIIGLYLGSRAGVIKRHTPIFLEALRQLSVDHPDLRVVIPTFDKYADGLRAATAGFPLQIDVISDPLLKPMAMRAANIALAVSGTVGLELAVANVPHIIGYKMGAMTWALLQRMVRTPYAHLVNIMLNAPVVPEFLQSACTPQKLASGLRDLIEYPATRARQQIEFARVRQMIGEGAALKPADQAAQFILSRLPTPQV